MTKPAETPAAAAIARTVVFVNPCAANSTIAASRIRSAVSGAVCGACFFELMFNIKRTFNDSVNLAPRGSGHLPPTRLLRLLVRHLIRAGFAVSGNAEHCNLFRRATGRSDSAHVQY